MTQEVLQAIPTVLRNSLKHISKLDNHVVVEEVRKYINKSLIDGVENEEIVDSVNTMIESLSPFVEESTQDFKDITLTKAIEENIELVDFSTVLRRVAPDKYAPYLGNIKITDQNGSDVADGIMVYVVSIDEHGNRGYSIGGYTTSNSHIDVEDLESHIFVNYKTFSKFGLVIEPSTELHPTFSLVDENAWLLDLEQMVDGVYTVQFNIPDGE